MSLPLLFYTGIILMAAAFYAYAAANPATARGRMIRVLAVIAGPLGFILFALAAGAVRAQICQ